MDARKVQGLFFAPACMLHTSVYLMSGSPQTQLPATAAAVNESHADVNDCRHQMRPLECWTKDDTTCWYLLGLMQAQKAEQAASGKQTVTKKFRRKPLDPDERYAQERARMEAAQAQRAAQVRCSPLPHSHPGPRHQASLERQRWARSVVRELCHCCCLTVSGFLSRRRCAGSGGPSETCCGRVRYCPVAPSPHAMPSTPFVIRQRPCSLGLTRSAQ